MRSPRCGPLRTPARRRPWRRRRAGGAASPRVPGRRSSPLTCKITNAHLQDKCEVWGGREKGRPSRRPALSLYVWQCWLLGGEALAGVEPGGPAVEHRVLDDGDGQLAVLVGPAHALREGGVLGERVLELLRNARG